MQASAALPRFSKDGSRLAFRSRVGSINPVAIPFDPVTLRAGAPVLLDTRNNIRVPSGVSPDGKQIAYFSIGESQEDLFIGPPDGSMRRVTDDPARDRAPMFTPDGRSLVFYSNRDGNRVGGHQPRRRNASARPPGQAMARGSPALSYRGADGLQAWAFTTSGTHAVAMLSNDEANGVKWLDNRRIVYFDAAGWQLIVLDTVTRKRVVVPVRLGTRGKKEMFAVGRDDKTDLLRCRTHESDVWIVERK